MSEDTAEVPENITEPAVSTDLRNEALRNEAPQDKALQHDNADDQDAQAADEIASESTGD